jgi:uncharacterized protein (TIGR00369 family)
MIWEEPAKGGYPNPAFIAVPGVDRMRGWATRKVPPSPMNYLTELRLTQASLGHSTFTMPASPWFANSAGLISGGVLATIADAALGSVVHSAVGAGQVMTTAELSLSLLRPIAPQPGRVISGSGQLIHSGRSLGLSEAFLYNEASGELIAHGTSRCTIFPPIDPLPKPPDGKLLDMPEPGSDPDDPLRRPVEGEAIPQEVFETHSGVEVLRGLIAGELPRPPIYHLTGLRLVEADEGSTVVVLPCSKWLSTSAGTVQGGFTAMLAESAMTAAAFSTAPADTAVATLDFKVNYLRPVFPDGEEITARARILHRGRTLVIAAAELTNAEGKQVALATGTSMYLPGRPANLVGVELGSSSSDPEDDPGA